MRKDPRTRQLNGLHPGRPGVGTADGPRRKSVPQGAYTQVRAWPNPLQADLAGGSPEEKTRSRAHAHQGGLLAQSPFGALVIGSGGWLIAEEDVLVVGFTMGQHVEDGTREQMRGD